MYLGYFSASKKNCAPVDMFLFKQLRLIESNSPKKIEISGDSGLSLYDQLMAAWNKLPASERLTHKRKVTAYQLFMKHEGKKFKDANPNTTFGERSKQLGQLWKDASVKKKFEALAAEENSRASPSSES